MLGVSASQETRPALHCPSCGYSWEGLPPGTICSECGLVRATLRKQQQFRAGGRFLGNAMKGLFFLLFFAIPPAVIERRFQNADLELLGAVAALTVFWFWRAAVARVLIEVFCFDDYVALRSSRWDAWRNVRLADFRRITVERWAGFQFLSADGTTLRVFPIRDLGGIVLAREIAAYVEQWQQERAA